MPAKYYARGNKANRALLRCVILLLVLAASPGTPSRAKHSTNGDAILMSAPSGADSVVVTTTSETVDGDTSSFANLNAQPGPDGAISLREAMLAANATPAGPSLTIAFAIPTSDGGYDSGSGTWKIVLGAGGPPYTGAALPPLARGDVTIDGSTQSTGPRPPIVLDGYNVTEAAGLSNGITITSPGNTLRRLTLMNFWDDGLLLNGANATDNRIVGCYIGTDERGTGAQPNGTGIDIRGGASHNTIGGATPAARNLIAGNNWNSGVVIQDPTTARNTIAGNWIGVNASGQAALRNTFAGVYIRYGAHDNLIGGAGQGNLISGNDWGIDIDGGVANTVAGNIVGLDANGQSPLPNADAGIVVLGGAHDNVVGGTAGGVRNVISGNGQSSSAFGQGIYISDQGTTNNTVQGNYIGVDVSGNLPGGNYRQGVLIASNARGNLVGGTGVGAGNVIAYNGLGGIRIDSASNRVIGNVIGMGANRATPLGNQYNGVRISGDDNVIGPNNQIAYNQLSGIMLSGSNTVVVSNTIQSNTRSGICVAGPGTNIIGNTIVANGGASSTWPDCDIQGGVVITGTGDTQVDDNTILDNRGPGVVVRSGRVNRIFTNSISGNSPVGIQLLYGGNGEIAPPTLTEIDSTRVSGVSCPGCYIEIFTDFSNQGKFFLDKTTARPDGSFEVALPSTNLPGTHLTATLTDQEGNTSPFAPPIELPPPPPPPPPPFTYAIYVPIIVR